MSIAPYRALVVDDEVVARRMVTHALQQEGFSCDNAGDGIEATSLIAAGRYDLVVTDLRMPNKHGHSLLTDLLAGPSPPVLIVHTSVDEPRMTKDLLARGVDDIVYKPTSYAVLGARAKILVDRRRASQSDTPGRLVKPDVSGNERALCQERSSKLGSCDDLGKRLADVANVLPISGTALEVYRLVTKEDTEADTIARAIERDASLAAEVLRIGNSAHYNRGAKQVSDLREVVLRVGCLRMAEIALAASARSVLRKQQFPWLDVDLAWKRSVAAGIALDALVAQGNHRHLANGLFLSALMYPLGRVVLAMLYPDQHKTLTAQCERSGEPLSAAEDRTFLKSHTETTADLLAGWGIPKEVTAPLRRVLDPYPKLTTFPAEERTRIELVKLAILIGRIAAGSWQPWDTVDFPPSPVLRRLHIRSVTDILATVRMKSEEMVGSQDEVGFDAKHCEASSITSVVGYWNPAGGMFDFLAELLPSLGLRPAYSEYDAQKVIIANCLECQRSQLASQLKLRAEQDLLVITNQNNRRNFAGLKRLLVLPTSYYQLRAAVLHNSDVITRPIAVRIT